MYFQILNCYKILRNTKNIFGLNLKMNSLTLKDNLQVIWDSVFQITCMIDIPPKTNKKLKNGTLLAIVTNIRSSFVTRTFTMHPLITHDTHDPFFSPNIFAKLAVTKETHCIILLSGLCRFFK